VGRNERWVDTVFVFSSRVTGTDIIISSFHSNNVFNTHIILSLSDNIGKLYKSWLMQANHIFHHLKIMSNLKDHGISLTNNQFGNLNSTVLTDWIYYKLEILAPTTEGPPPGFLFLRPVNHIQTGPSSFRWLECPTYKSVDPSSVERLSTEAARFGFPTIQLNTEILGMCCDDRVYAGLRQFHQAQDFSPNSQDVAVIYFGNLPTR
jgi:hypothetical protein